MIGLENYGLSAGCNADFLLVKSDCITSAVLLITESWIIVKRGKVILEN
jgi:cytosine/adenosine deaminase-related metal-dependent hydrolase